MLSFVSIKFLLFVTGTIVCYYILPKKIRWIELLVASIIFYACAGVEKMPFIMSAAIVAYIATRGIESVYRKNATDKKSAKKWLLSGVFIVLLMLVYSKTGEAVCDSLVSILSLEQIDIKILVPLGVSYYTFSVIGYMADVYWKKTAAEHNFLKLFLFMIYFPHILQGPIARYKTLAPQLVEGHAYNHENMCYGLQRVVWGYFKKMVIADRLAILTGEVFGNYEQYPGLYIAIAIVCATIELYCDFSGCIDIVIGISETMSIRLDENFQRPFFSKSASEFWRRWHITLGTWFKDYVYMPMVINPKLIMFSKSVQNKFGKRAAKSVMTIVPLSVVWILTGVWHSTGWNYVVWGIYWGVIIILSTVFTPELKRMAAFFKFDVSSRGYQMFQTMRTFVLFLISRLLTAPGSLSATWGSLKQLVVQFNIWILFDESLYKLGLDQKDFIVVILAVIVLWRVEWLQEKGMKIRETIASYPLPIRWGIYYLCIVAIIIFGVYGSGNTGSVSKYMQY